MEEKEKTLLHKKALNTKFPNPFVLGNQRLTKRYSVIKEPTVNMVATTHFELEEV